MTADQLQAQLNDPTIHTIYIDSDITTGKPFIVTRRNGRKNLDIIGIGKNWNITQTDPTKNIFEYQAASVNDMLINTQTWWSFYNLTFTGGAIAINMKGGYQGEISRCVFNHQRVAAIDLRLCLQTAINKCFINLPHKDGIILSTGGATGAGAANSQCNSTVLTNIHFYCKEGSETMLKVHSTNGVLGSNIIFEGGNPKRCVSFQGSSTHARLLTLINTHVECHPTDAAFFTEISGTMNINGLQVQSASGFRLFHMAHNGTKLVVDNLTQMPSACYATVAESCQINIKNSVNQIYQESFWRQEDSTQKLPKYNRFESAYRSGAADTETGNDDPEGETDVNILEGAIPFRNFKPTPEHPGLSIQLVSVNPNEPFTIVAKVHPTAWGGTLFGLGMKTTVAGVGSGYNMLRVYSIKSNVSDLGSVRIHMIGQETIDYGVQFIDNALNPNQPYTFYLHFNGTKFTAGRIGGQFREYEPVNWRDKNFTELCAGHYVFPNRPNGYDFFSGQVEGVLLQREVTLNEVYQVAELI